MTDNAIVVIGCGAGGGTAAQFARKTDRKRKVIIFEKGPYPQYSKCGLPYVISGVISKPLDLVEFSEDWFSKAKIDLHLNTTVTSIDTDKKIITAKNADNDIITQPFSSLIIATGASPSLPPIKNITKDDRFVDGIFTIRTIDDSQKVLDGLPHIEHATIIGAGLIGLEMADCLVHRGKKVTVVEALPHILPMLDDDVTKIIETRLKEDITLFTNHFAVEVNVVEDKVSEVVIVDRGNEKKESIKTDMIVIAAGTSPEVSLAERIGCEIGATGAIKVNDHSETSVSDVYAVGDCTEYVDFITKTPVPVGLGSIAVRQGIAAGVNAAGGSYSLPKGVLQTFTSDFFDMQIAAVGPASSHIDSLKTVSGKHQGSSLPDYYPGGKPILMKLLVEADSGKILTAQALGENAAQRVNTYATAILSEMTVDMFRKLETAYAPPIAPTLDVVTVVADIAHMKLQRLKKR